MQLCNSYCFAQKLKIIMKKLTTALSTLAIMLLMIATSCKKENIRFDTPNTNFKENNFRDTPYIPTGNIKLDTPYVPTGNIGKADTPYVKH